MPLGPRSNSNQILLLVNCLLGGADVPLLGELSESLVELRLAAAVAGVRLGDDGWAKPLLEMLHVIMWMVKRGDSQPPTFQCAKGDAIAEEPPQVLLASP